MEQERHKVRPATVQLTTSGTIVSIQLCPGHRKPMVMVDEVEAVVALGLKGDRHALQDSSRQILLIESETLEAFGLTPGQVKENITTAGISLRTLARKQRLKIGADVVVELTGECAPCFRMDEIRSGLK
ncbi:MAG TPA: MOSC domain-containing protein, partial [Bacteroidota bacterium]|nr:MOSC domain-containing protein [Bacteroidota bacterium]